MEVSKIFKNIFYTPTPPPLGNVENTALLVEGAILNILDKICSFCEVFDICLEKYLLGHHTFWSGRPCLRQTFSHKHNFVPENQKDDGADDHDEGDGYVGEDEHNADDDDGNHDGDGDDDGDDGDDDGGDGDDGGDDNEEEIEELSSEALQ